jgi:hypothetical protein
MYGRLHYGPLHGQGPMGQPAYLRSTALAPQAPYVGGELARLTSMTPFMAGDFVPVRVMRREVPSCEVSSYGGPLSWLQGVIEGQKAKKAPPDAQGYNVQLGLKRGDSSTAVTQLQTAINDLSGQEIGIDGKFGAGTEEGLVKYQNVNGLVATGYVDAATKAHMADPLGLMAAYDTKQEGKAEVKAAAAQSVAEVLKAAFMPADPVAPPSGSTQTDTTPWGLIAVGGILTVAILGGIIVASR